MSVVFLNAAGENDDWGAPTGDSPTPMMELVDARERIPTAENAEK